jgi:hypothetical protein
MATAKQQTTARLHGKNTQGPNEGKIICRLRKLWAQYTTNLFRPEYHLSPFVQPFEADVAESLRDQRISAVKKLNNKF